MKKLIAVDVDGTLLTSDRVIGPKTKKALIDVQKLGHKVVISSGRIVEGIFRYGEELEMDKYESYVSGQNGSLVVDMMTKEVIVEHSLDYDIAKEVLNYANEIDMDYVIFHKGTMYTNSKDTYKLQELIDLNLPRNVKVVEDLHESIYFNPPVILFSIRPNMIGPKVEKMEERFLDRLNGAYSGEYYYELMDKQASKGNALLEIADELGIAHENIIAFGDQENDESMVRMAHTGIAMGNAIPELKEIADYVTLTNDEEGIAHYINEFIL